VTILHATSEYDQAGGHSLRRFYFRALVGVLGPLVVIGYFISVWRFYLVPADPNSPVAFGPIGAKWIFYGWFVAGVIGLNLSLYGLEGVEAAMLMEPTWSVGNGMKIMMHADKTWSGPGGWMKTAKWIWQSTRRAGQLKLPPKLWFILALPSILVFTAYPLSGLTMEMTQGYLHGKKTDDGVTVTGFSYANFNERLSADITEGARTNWRYAQDARVPGHGAVYTAKGYDRSQHGYLQNVPSVLPGDDGLSGVFLSAQAANPIEGNSWGLLLQYNCSVIDDIKDFRVLSQRNASLSKFNPMGLTTYQTNNGTKTILVRNQTTISSWVSNMDAVMEIGYEPWLNQTTTRRLLAEDPTSSFTTNTGCYYNKVENITGDYPGINQEQVFEVMLWQNLANISNTQKLEYDLSLDHNITGAHGAYDQLNFVLDKVPESQKKNVSAKLHPNPLSAIGVQCKASGSVGTADINGVTSSYTNFVRTDTPINVQTARCANRFSAVIPDWLMSKYNEKEWLSTLFSSVAAPPPFYMSQSNDAADVTDVGTGYLVQLKYLQAQQLRQSMLRAYAAYATLMYNGGQGFTTSDGSQIGIQNPNITEFVPATVLTRGVMPAEVPLALFGIWAIFGSLMGVFYGFRRRWSAILDGYAMFRLGADLPDSVKREFEKQSNTLEVEECRGLERVPGLVGDVKPEMWLGRIGLVRKSVAVKGKMYE
jgi:hypothetical protein